MGEHRNCSNLPGSKDSTICRLKVTISSWSCRNSKRSSLFFFSFAVYSQEKMLRRIHIYAILSCSVGQTPNLGDMHCVCLIHWRCGAGGPGVSVRFPCHLGHISLRWRSVLCVSLRVFLLCSTTFVWFVRQRGFSESSQWQTNQLRFLCVSCVSLCYRFVIPCYLCLPCFFVISRCCPIVFSMFFLKLSFIVALSIVFFVFSRCSVFSRCFVLFRFSCFVFSKCSLSLFVCCLKNVVIFQCCAEGTAQRKSHVEIHTENDMFQIATEVRVCIQDLGTYFHDFFVDD